MEETKIGSLRAVRVEDDLVLAGVSPDALGACAPRMLLGRPERELLALFLRDEVPDGARVVRSAQLVDWYGVQMHRMSTALLCAMEQAGMKILGVSLSDGRVSAAFSGRWDPALPERIFRFTL